MITKELLYAATKIECNVHQMYDCIALSNGEHPNSLAFFDDLAYLEQLNNNANITGVMVAEEHQHLISKEKIIILTEDPRWVYFTVYNYLAEKNKINFETVIDESSKIHKTAYVADLNVIIGKNCILHPNVTILEDVEIGDNCIIQAGSVIGSEGFEYKKTSKGILPVKHDGKVLIKNKVHIGANTCIDKGFSHLHTIINDCVMIDNLVHVAHGVQIGENSFIIAGTVLGGSTIIENDVWVGINASTAPGIRLGNHSFVSMGAVVTKDVANSSQVTGNFAIEHTAFLRSLKNKLNE